PVPGLTPAPVPGLKPNTSAGQRVSANAAPTDVPKPKVPVTTPTPIPGRSPTPLPQGTRMGIGKTGVPVDQAFFGHGVAAMHMESKPTILLADDDKRIRIVFRLCLERMGFRVVEAEDGNEAWKKIQQGGLALVCLDMKMPGLHGLEVLQRMNNSQIDLPVIICSAYDQLKDEFIIATHPRLRYLVKPVASEALEKAVKELVGEPAKGA
ncbi:MAG: response regulator, partial [Planctomycetota bacterium]|nr:response regulator [Planctomycetota bacterium]